jgi:hypothetical protein
MRSKRFLSMLLVVGLLTAACGGSGDGSVPAADEPSTPDEFGSSFAGGEVYPVFASTEVVVGENRFLVGLLDDNDAPIASPDIEMSVSFVPLEGGTKVAAEAMDFIYTVPNERGLYVAHPTFDMAGDWGAVFKVNGEGLDETLRARLEVKKEGTTPAIGDPAPPSDTPTADDVGDLAEISTAQDPDPAFYETSVKEALANEEPFVLVFATPKFCASQVCGPTLEDVGRVAGDFPKLTFIHSEIYEDLDPTQPPVEAVTEWGLPSEPWVFVVDAKGRIAAKYEGAVSPAELKPVLQKLAGS